VPVTVCEIKGANADRKHTRMMSARRLRSRSVSNGRK
jgi:hypothetical protein